MTNLAKGLLLMFLCFPLEGQAEQLWNDISQSFLYGNDYAVGDKRRAVLTFEYAGGHDWGDHFFFLDRIDGSNSGPDVYTELLLRLSGSKLTGSQMSFGIVKDLLLATRLEYASATDEKNALIGIGADLAIPGFTFLKVNVFHRENDSVSDNAMLNFAWAYPFALEKEQFVYDGFVDWVSGVAGEYATSLNFTSQLKWLVTQSDQYQVYVGVEFSYWRNKFGIRDSADLDTDESNFSALFKVHF